MLSVPRVAHSIRVDGDLHKAPWTQLAPIALAPSHGRATPRGFQSTALRVCHDGERLYVAFDCEDGAIVATHRGRNAPIYEEDVVEAFLAPGGDPRRYFELETSPRDAWFEARVESPDGRRDDDARRPRLGLRRLRARGARHRLAASGDWSAEWAIPFASLGVAAPRAGDRWRANFFRIDQARRRRVLGVVADASPIRPTSTCRDRFGVLVVRVADGAPVAGDECELASGHAHRRGAAPSRSPDSRCSRCCSAPGAARATGGADGHFEQRRSTHFLLREDVAIDRRTGPQGAKRFEHDVLAVLEAATTCSTTRSACGRADASKWRCTIRRSSTSASPRCFPFPAAGFYGGVIRVRGDVQVTPRLASTLHHELVHAALDAAAPSLALPAWLNEGLAEWFAARAAGRPALGERPHAHSSPTAPAAARCCRSKRSRSRASCSWPREDAPLAYLQATALVDQMAQPRRRPRAARAARAALPQRRSRSRAAARDRPRRAQLEPSTFADSGSAER